MNMYYICIDLLKASLKEFGWYLEIEPLYRVLCEKCSSQCHLSKKLPDTRISILAIYIHSLSRSIDRYKELALIEW